MKICKSISTGEQVTCMAIRVAQVVGKMVGGGVTSVVMNYYRHIDREKIQFDFLVDADSTHVPAAEIKALGGRVIMVPPYQKVVPYHKELVSIFRREQYPIVHSHINTLSVFPLFAAARAGVPVRIAHSHSTAGKGEFARNVMKYTLRPFSRAFATHCCACAEHAGEWLFGKSTVDKGQVKIFYNAIDIEPFRFDPKVRTQVRRELALSDELVVGHVGRLVHTKNHRFLLDVFCELARLQEEPNSILLLIGQGPLEPEIKSLALAHGIENRVRFLGQRSDIARLYQAMDMFLFPSFYEGLGLACIEAQCSGLPCLASDQVPQEVDLFGTVKFLPLSASAADWANEAVRLMEKSGERKGCGDHVRATRYDIRQAAKELEQFYCSVL